MALVLAAPFSDFGFERGRPRLPPFCCARPMAGMAPRLPSWWPRAHSSRPTPPRRRVRARSWPSAAMRRSTRRRCKLALHISRARRRARPLHPIAAYRRLHVSTPRSTEGSAPRNADLGGPPIWGRRPVSWVTLCSLIPRPASHKTLWPCCDHPHRWLRATNPHLRRRTRRAFGAARARMRCGAQPPPAGRSRPVWRTQAARHACANTPKLVGRTYGRRRRAAGGALGACPALKRP